MYKRQLDLLKVKGMDIFLKEKTGCEVIECQKEAKVLVRTLKGLGFLKTRFGRILRRYSKDEGIQESVWF